MNLWYHSSMKMRFNIKKKHWSKASEKLVTKAIRYAAYRYGIQDIDLVVKLGNPNDKYWGFSDFDDFNYMFKIWLYPSDYTRGVLRTVFHEMTHVKQFFYGELDLDRSIPRWKGKKCGADYKNQPWEQEAHEMEVVLLKEFLDIQVDLVI